MKKTPCIANFLLAAGLVLSLSACTSPQPIEPIDITAEIQSLNNGFEADFAKGDATGLAARYTEEGKLMPPNGAVLTGRDAIEGYWEATIGAGVVAQNMTTTRATSYGTAAVETGTVEIATPDGQVLDKVKFMVHWKLVNDEWKMHEDIWNSSLPVLEPPVENGESTVE